MFHDVLIYDIHQTTPNRKVSWDTAIVNDAIYRTQVIERNAKALTTEKKKDIIQLSLER